MRIKRSSGASTTDPPALDPVLLLVCELQLPSEETLVLSALLRTLLKVIPDTICVNDDSVDD